LIYEYTIWWK